MPAPGADPEKLPELARSSLEERLARYKVPKLWRVVDRLPGGIPVPGLV